MKKLIINVICLFFIASLIFCFYYKFYQKEQEPILSGFLESENLYNYYLNNDKYSLNGYYISNNDIYFLLDKEENYELYRENIYESKATKIGKIDTTAYCNLDKELITCSSVNKASIYDLNLNLKYETDLDEEKLIYIVPYKDTFLKIDNNTLILTQNNEEVTFKTLKEELKDYTFTKYYYTNDNTYLLYAGFDTNYFYLYDIKNDNYEEITLANYNYYKNGFYFYNEETYQIYNLKDNTTKELPNSLKTSNNYKTTLSSDNKTLYLIDNDEENIEIIDLENNTLKKAPLTNFNTNEIIDLIHSNDFLYLITNKEKTNLYLYDLPSLSLDKINISEYLETKEKINIDLINELKTKYNVNIKIKEDAIIKYPDFTAEVLSDYRIINKALTKIENILNKLNADFFSTFYENSYEGLNIYLTGELTPSNYETQYSDPVAYSLIFNKEYMIVLDIREESLKESFCHELMHNIEYNIEKNYSNTFVDWEKYNPPEFTYSFSYTKGSSYDYTIYEEDENNVYFIDKYAHSYPSEDRARTFEKICACENDSIVSRFPNLLTKALYLKDTIISNFPSLERSTIFDSLEFNEE